LSRKWQLEARPLQHNFPFEQSKDDNSVGDIEGELKFWGWDILVLFVVCVICVMTTSIESMEDGANDGKGIAVEFANFVLYGSISGMICRAIELTGIKKNSITNVTDKTMKKRATFGQLQHFSSSREKRSSLHLFNSDILYLLIGRLHL
jgi:hypothetical protein